LVRMRSSGESMIPAATAAATATPKVAQGYEAFNNSAPGPIAVPGINPGSGTFSKAVKRPLAHFSSVSCSRWYMKVVFEPFHTPQAPSFVHS